MFKNLLYFILYFFVSLLIGNVFISLFNNFNIINKNIFNIISFIFPLFLIIINSYLLGKKSNKKGFLEGLKFGGIITFTFLLITIITNNFSPKVLIYYIILIISSVMSSTIGINNKEKNA